MLVTSLILIVGGLLATTFARAIQRYNREVNQSHPIGRVFAPRDESDGHAITAAIRLIGVAGFTVGVWLLATRV